MPIINTPAGPVMVDDGATPDVIQKIMAQHNVPMKPQAQQQPAMSADQQEVQRRVAAEKKNNASGVFGQAGADYWRRTTQGFMGNFWDEAAGAASAATKGVVNAVKDRNLGDISHEYRLARDTERQMSSDAETRTGGTGTLAEIAGALANPIGDGAAALKFAGKAVPLLGKVGAKIASAPALVKGALAAGNQGAVNAVGADDSAQGIGDLATRAGQGFLVGGATGGALGGAGVGARRVTQIFADRAPQAAERMAYGRIGQMLGKGKVTPADAEAEIAASKAAGNDAMVGDMTPGLQAQSGALSKRPEIPSSNDMIKGARDRLDDRQTRFQAELNNRLTLANGDSAKAHIDATDAARKAQGAADYPSVLKKNFVWNDDLEKWVNEAPDQTKAVLKSAMDLVRGERQDPKALGISFNSAGDVVFDKVPSMKAFDYTKRAFDQHIAQAYRNGDNNGARILSGELDGLKAGIARSNPAYAPVLAKQRDAYQKIEATKFGTDAIKRLKTDPVELMQDINKTDPANHEDIRTGIADALNKLAFSKVDPAAFINQASKTPEQRKVLEFAFGGPQKLQDFQQWMGREARGTSTDKVIAPGYQSNTFGYHAANQSLGDDAASLAEHVGRGFGFGGPIGAGAAFLRKMGDLTTLSPHALDAMAKALMSDGQGLAGKVSAAEKFNAVRKASNAKWAKRLGKAGQQQVTDYTGN